MKTTSLILSLVTALFIASCASKKPNTSPDINAEAAHSIGMPLELNGDSDNGTAGELKTVFFVVDSPSLSEEARSILKNAAAFLERYPAVNIQIEGHADERGGRQYNLALGEKRAKSVQEYLKALGIKKNRITTISYGNEKPMAQGNDESSWSKNRRANFVVTAK